jgi:hypothetical protein
MAISAAIAGLKFPRFDECLGSLWNDYLVNQAT